jgi:hypothetical protein
VQVGSAAITAGDSRQPVKDEVHECSKACHPFLCDIEVHQFVLKRLLGVPAKHGHTLLKFVGFPWPGMLGPFRRLRHVIIPLDFPVGRRGPSMFNDKPYLEVNREERFYCAILLHLILSSRAFRERFFGAIDAKHGTKLDPGDFQVFCEIAILRDYWNDLGDPEKYSEETHQRRMMVLEILLPLAGVEPSQIGKQTFFWTRGFKSKLWSPGHWSEEAIDSTDWTDGTKKEMKTLKHAFNSKPDLIILSRQWAVLVEAKVESGFGHGQRGNQKMVARLMKVLIPCFRDTSIVNMTLTCGGEGLRWIDVLGMLEGIEIDGFSRECMEQTIRVGT